MSKILKRRIVRYTGFAFLVFNIFQKRIINPKYLGIPKNSCANEDFIFIGRFSIYNVVDRCIEYKHNCDVMWEFAVSVNMVNK